MMFCFVSEDNKEEDNAALSVYENVRLSQSDRSTIMHVD